jgi:hypothetical protein
MLKEDAAGSTIFKHASSSTNIYKYSVPVICKPNSNCNTSHTFVYRHSERGNLSVCNFNFFIIWRLSVTLRLALHKKDVRYIKTFYYITSTASVVSGQSSWLPDFLRSSGSGTGSTQLR